MPCASSRRSCNGSKRPTSSTRERAAGLRRRAVQQPSGAAAALVDARRVRASLRALAERGNTTEKARNDTLAEINRILGRSAGTRRLEPNGDGSFARSFVPVGDAFAGLMIPVVESAADALVIGELARIRRCADGRCPRVFFDGTKNGRRRWCDMATCGNRAKAARHRVRMRQADDEAIQRQRNGRTRRYAPSAMRWSPTSADDARAALTVEPGAVLRRRGVACLTPIPPAAYQRPRRRRRPGPFPAGRGPRPDPPPRRARSRSSRRGPYRSPRPRSFRRNSRASSRMRRSSRGVRSVESFDRLPPHRATTVGRECPEARRASTLAPPRVVREGR